MICLQLLLEQPITRPCYRTETKGKLGFRLLDGTQHVRAFASGMLNATCKVYLAFFL